MQIFVVIDQSFESCYYEGDIPSVTLKAFEWESEAERYLKEHYKPSLEIREVTVV